MLALSFLICGVAEKGLATASTVVVSFEKQQRTVVSAIANVINRRALLLLPVRRMLLFHGSPVCASFVNLLPTSIWCAAARFLLYYYELGDHGGRANNCSSEQLRGGEVEDSASGVLHIPRARCKADAKCYYHGVR